MSQIRYRRDIDGLRCVAVLPVVLHHSNLPIAPGGFVGVDIFFVISGFLITSILAREIDEDRFSIVDFYERRIRRILPALLTVILACLVVGWFILLPDEYVGLAQSSVAAIFFSANIWFWRVASDYFADSVTTEPLLHIWSLGVEEQFYVFLPLLLWATTRLRDKWGWMIGLISLASLGLSIAITNVSPTANFYLLPTRVWELGLGAVLAVTAAPPARSRIVNDAVSLIGLLLIAASIFLIDETTPFPGLAALPPCLGAAAIIWSGQRDETAGGRLLSAGLLVWFGYISYSLYLWHWPVMVAARLITGELFLTVPVALFCIVVSIVLGWASWRFVERPFRQRDGFWRPPARIFGGAAAAGGLLVAIAAAVFLTNGIPQRVPGAVFAEITEAKAFSSIETKCRNRKPTQPPCKLGSQAAQPGFVIWGDSHAAAILPGFENALLRADQSAVAFTKSGCPPLPGLWRADNGKEHGCDTHNAAVLKRIAKDYPDTKVILVARWAFATESERAPGEAGNAAILARTGEEPRGDEGNAVLVEESLNRLVSQLQASNHRVTIIGSVPEQGRDIPRYRARSAIFGTIAPNVGGERITSSMYQERNARFIPLAMQSGAQFIELGAFMCTETCMTSTEGKLIYRDDDHLSVHGATWLVGEISAQLLQERTRP